MRISGRALIAAAVAAVMGSANSAAAQWSSRPNGDLLYTFGMSTSGVFSCATTVILIGSCTASGNAVTLERDGAWMMMSFAGTTGTLTASSDAQLVSLGTLTTTFGGSGPFVPPLMKNRWHEAARLHVGLRPNTPGASSGGFCRPFVPREHGLVSYGQAYGCSRHFTIVPPPSPPGRHDAIIFAHVPRPLIGYEPGTYEYTARMSLIPEPGTWVMLGTGLVGLGGVGVIRRRRGV